jgi:hypothetical protein
MCPSFGRHTTVAFAPPVRAKDGPTPKKGHVRTTGTATVRVESLDTGQESTTTKVSFCWDELPPPNPLRDRLESSLPMACYVPVVIDDGLGAIMVAIDGCTCAKKKQHGNAAS